MTDSEALKHLESLFTQMFERMDNIEGRMSTMDKDFAEYCEHNPKMDEQWAEERIRTLEMQMRYMIKGFASLIGEKTDRTILQLISEMDADDDVKKRLIDEYKWAISVSKLDRLKKKDSDNG